MHALISGPIAGDSTLSGTALSALLHSGEGLEGSARRYLNCNVSHTAHEAHTYANLTTHNVFL